MTEKKSTANTKVGTNQKSGWNRSGRDAAAASCVVFATITAAAAAATVLLVDDQEEWKQKWSMWSLELRYIMNLLRI
jgi:hypothetical protein